MTKSECLHQVGAVFKATRQAQNALEKYGMTDGETHGYYVGCSNTATEIYDIIAQINKLD